MILDCQLFIEFVTLDTPLAKRGHKTAVSDVPRRDNGTIGHSLMERKPTQSFEILFYMGVSTARG